MNLKPWRDLIFTQIDYSTYYLKNILSTLKIRIINQNIIFSLLSLNNCSILFEFSNHSSGCIMK